MASTPGRISRHRLIPLRITLSFAMVSGLWIFFSDQILAFLIQDTRVMAELSTVKGWFYVLVVSLFLYVLIHRNLVRLASAHEEVVRHRERLLVTQFTIDQSADMVLWVDSGAHIVYSNLAASRILGYPPEALGNLTIPDIEESLSQGEWVLIWERLLAEHPLRLIRSYRTREGRVFPVELTADLIEFQGKTFACAYVRDISDRLRVEEQLRLSQKMESVGTLAAGVAHDFNNILAVIHGCSELVEKVGDDRPKVLSLLEQIQAAVQRAARLVQSLLAFSRNQKLQPRRFALNDLLTSMEEFLGRLLGEGVRLEVSCCTADSTVEADFAQWEQVLLNLAVNARDAMLSGGTLVIRTWVSADRVFLSVRDSGSGIPVELLDRVFEPYFTTKEEGGTGLGLSTVYGIVRQHQGNIRVHSPVDPASGTPGTEFLLDLPLAPVLA